MFVLYQPLFFPFLSADESITKKNFIDTPLVHH